MHRLFLALDGDLFGSFSLPPHSSTSCFFGDLPNLAFASWTLAFYHDPSGDTFDTENVTTTIQNAPILWFG
jgi:hypothetical protein